MNISVIIPLYNKVRHIRRAVESVLAQTYRDFELIVVDDGSTDGSAAVVREINDLRIRLVVQENVGECAARNRGINEAFGDLIAFLDADDEWEPTFLLTVMELQVRYPDAGIFATAYQCCENNILTRPCYEYCPRDQCGGLLEDYFQTAMGPSPVTSSSVMIPKRILNEVGLFPPGVRRGGDLHTWSRIALRYRVAWSPVNGAIYHLSADNRVCTERAAVKDIAAALPIEEFLQAGNEPISSMDMAREYLVRWRLRVAWDCYLDDKKSWMWNLMEKTRSTRRFRIRRLILLGVIRVPVSIIQGALTVRHKLLRISGLRK